MIDLPTDVRVNGTPVAATNLLVGGRTVEEALADGTWGLEPPYEVSFRHEMPSFSGETLEVAAFGSVSAHPGFHRFRGLGSGATNEVRSPVLASPTMTGFYGDFLYKFEADHAGSGLGFLDCDEGLRCGSQATNLPLYRLERTLLFLPPDADGPGGTRTEGFQIEDTPSGAPARGAYDAQGLDDGSSATSISPIFPCDLDVKGGDGIVVPDCDEWWLGAFTEPGKTATLVVGDALETAGIPTNGVATLSKTSDVGGVFPDFQTLTWRYGEPPPSAEALALTAAAPGVATFELRLSGEELASWDRVKITSVFIDLDIDSDNNGVVGGADEEVEDSIEDDDSLPGKALFLNELDSDYDGIPDFADGYDLNFGGVTQKADNASRKFVPMRLRIGNHVTNGTIRFECTMADKTGEVSRSGRGTDDNDPFVFTCNNQKIRIWTKDGNKQRSRKPFPDGDLIVPDTCYSIPDLIPTLVRTFFVEAINGSETLADIRIQANLDLDVTLVPNLNDAVRATVFKIDAVHPEAGDFETGQEGKIMISTKQDAPSPTRYHTRAITTIAGTPAQTNDHEVVVTACVSPVPPSAVPNLKVFFEVIDPDDLSHYEGKTIPGSTSIQGNTFPDDNRDPDKQIRWNHGSPVGYIPFQGRLSSRTEDPILCALNGKSVYAAETTLSITKRFSGDNYRVRATLQNPNGEPFDIISGMANVAFSAQATIKETRNLVAWKRIYLELDTMYEHGCTVTALVQSTPGQMLLPVDSTADFSIGDSVVVFWKGDSTSSVIRGFSTSTLIIDSIAKNIPRFAGVRPENEPVPLNNATQRLANAFGLHPDGRDGGAFIEFIPVDVWKEAIPKFHCFPNADIAFEFADEWFDQKSHRSNNVAQVVIGKNIVTSQFTAYGVTDGLLSICILFADNTPGTVFLQDTVAHEVGHRCGLSKRRVSHFAHIDEDNTGIKSHCDGDLCLMTSDRNRTDSVTEFCFACLLSGSSATALDSIRDREDH